MAMVRNPEEGVVSSKFSEPGSLWKTAMFSVSVAMATYNGGKNIRAQLDSLAEQQHLPTELVVTDDASSDETLAIVEDFANTAPFPLRIYRNTDRLGYRANFMRAADLCRSELISFCDQDDIWRPQKLSICAEPFADKEVLLVYHDADVVTAQGHPIGTLDQPGTTAFGLSRSLLPLEYALGFTQIFRRSLLGLSDLWHMSIDHKEANAIPMAHDQWFFFLASALGSVIHVDKRLVSYRQHGQNAYGWGARWRLVDRLSQGLSAFRGRAEQLASWERAALCRATILEQPKLAEFWRPRARVAAEKYCCLAALYGARRQIYSSVNSIDRWRAFHWMLMRHGYRPKPNWGLGGQALVADLLLGVPAGHSLSAPRRM